MKLLFTLVMLSILWLLMSGIYKPLLLGFGLLSVAIVLFVNVRMNTKDLSPVLLEIRSISSFKYFSWLIYEIFKSNIQVASIILDRKREIRPNFIDLHLSQRSELGRVIFANSITLTPGTVAIELEGNTMMVHALDACEESEDSLNSMGQLVAEIENDG